MSIGIRDRALSTQAVDILGAVRDHILANPEEFDMDEFFAHNGKCYTAACIAGWSILIYHKRPIEKACYYDAHPSDNGEFVLRPDDQAQAILRLSDEQALRLFQLENWPIGFEMAYSVATSANDRANVAADRINHFVSTGGAE